MESKHKTTDEKIERIVFQGLRRISNPILIDNLIELRAHAFYFTELYWLARRTGDKELRKRIRQRQNLCHERIYQLSNKDPLLRFVGVGEEETSFIPCFACGGKARLWDQNEGIGMNLLDHALRLGGDLLQSKILEPFSEFDKNLHESSEAREGRTLPYHPSMIESFTGQRFCSDCEDLEREERRCLRGARLMYVGDYLESNEILFHSKKDTVDIGNLVFNWKDIEFDGEALQTEWENQVEEVMMLFLRGLGDPLDHDAESETLVECRFLLDCLKLLSDKLDNYDMKRQLKAIMNLWI